MENTLVKLIDGAFADNVSIDCFVWVLRNKRQDFLDIKFAQLFNKHVISKYPKNYFIIITACPNDQKPRIVVKSVVDRYKLPDIKKVIAIDNPDINKVKKQVINEHLKEKENAYNLSSLN